MGAKDGFTHKDIVDANTPLHDSVTAGRSGKDEDKPKFGIGQKVKLLKEIVNDGTYPHAPIGTQLMPAGAIGYIKSMGEFLQVIRVYEVHFLGLLDVPVEIVGCREHELEAMEDYRDEVEEELEFMRKHREKYYSKD
ncbi:NifZ family protein [Arcobacter nitrofigilis DSM 7299]|uniref:NifZ family protein n=1 Tax=Arcobacter nitrofigilis (strain ATCC 33309 / DSM 7299 / CCUG 15893 / LMG 7604 / NCTC 12251 / CI) TaxID=572480 RepID=D5V3L7_ARCNC|nr:nitrogen fixation protein NifZ [Arcobacter nitrofigilis]ADG91728.1 NifZ family protein [Arcobacter nitrofigilis DSM 7299]